MDLVSYPFFIAHLEYIVSSRRKIMVRRQKIENHREPNNKYSIETKRSGIVPKRNCDAPVDIGLSGVSLFSKGVKLSIQ